MKPRIAAVHEFRNWQCAPKAQIITGGRIHPESDPHIRLSGDRKRSVDAWHKLPRPSSTLP